LALLLAGPACAQVSGNVTLLSDFRYRGTSLSNGLPTVQAMVAWDRSDGWYGGLQLSRVRFMNPDAQAELQAIPYVGYVRSLRPGLSAEAGVQYTGYSHSNSYDEPDVYVGLSGKQLHSRLSWTPHYFGRSPAWYAELDGSRTLQAPWRAIGHVGLLQTREYAEYGDARQRVRVDAAVGIAVSVRGFDARATWTAVGSGANATCVPWQCGARSGWVLSLSRSW
jgi:uncharacterized protein (TIGR02001 family)